MVAKVGRASSARWTWVLPPRMKVVSAFDATVVGEIGSRTRASGTPTLFRTSVTEAGERREQGGAAAPPTFACVWKLATGAGQLGLTSDAYLYGVPIWV